MFKKLLIVLILVLSLLALYFRVFGTSIVDTAEPITTPSVFQPVFPSRTPSDVPQTKLRFTPVQLRMQQNGTLEAEVFIEANENKVSAVHYEIGYDPKVFAFVSMEPVDLLGDREITVQNVDRKNGKITFEASLDLTKTQPIVGGDETLEIVLRPINQTITASELHFLPGTNITAVGVRGNALVSAAKAEVNLK